MKKKLIAMLLVFTMAVCIFPVSAFAAKPDEPVTQQYLKNGYYHISIYCQEKLVPENTVISYGSKGQYVTIAQMKLNEVAKYFAGAITAEEAAAKIQSRASIYMSEQYG